MSGEVVEPASARTAGDSVRGRVIVLVALFIGFGAAHLLASPHAHLVHDFLFKATYLQIILAAVWFGWRGGLAMSGATSALYLFHIFFQLRGHGAHDPVTLVLELFLYNVIALVAGVLTSRQAEARRALEAASGDLEASYQELRAKTRELVSAEEQLRTSERLRTAGELAAAMAHEVRNPLGGILGAAEILARPNATPETRAEFADVLKKEIMRLDRVIGDFLGYARPRAGEDAEATLGIALASTLRLLAPTFERQKITVTVEEPAPLRVRADTGQVQQVLLNLLLNGAQAMPNGGELRVTSRAEGDVAVVEIADSGHGIADALRPRIFEPFVSGRTGGSGLGLAISARIAERFGGHLVLLSSGPRGSVFELRLPLRT